MDRQQNRVRLSWAQAHYGISPRERPARSRLRSAVLLAACAFGVVAGISSDATAQLHFDIAVQENASDGRLSVHAFDFGALPQLGFVEGKRAYVRGIGISGNSLLLENPGFVSRVSATELDPVGLLPPAGGEGLFFNVLSPPLSTMPSLGGRTINFWDGSSPVSWGPTPDEDEGVEIIKGSFFNPDDTLTVMSGTSDLPGFAIGAASGGGSMHEHPKFLLLPDNGALPPAGPDDGVYLMLFELSYPSYAEWIPVFIGIEAFAGGGATQASAEAAIASDLLNPLCSDGIDNDKDGTVDAADAGCVDGDDMSERGAVAECDDGIDNDGDGFMDFHDLDGDGISDFGGDPECLHPGQMFEAPEPGFALALLLGASGLSVLGRRRSRLRKLC